MVNCINCNKEFNPHYGVKAANKFCSYSCYYEYRTKQHICIICGNQAIQYKNKKLYRKFCSDECAKQYKVNCATGRKSAKPFLKGKDNPMYIDGRTKFKITATQEYKDWRIAVFVRDDFTCQICGVRGGKLVAHHIKEKLLYPELVFDVTNGQTLCRECHKQTDNFGYRLLHYIFKDRRIAKIPQSWRYIA